MAIVVIVKSMFVGMMMMAIITIMVMDKVKDDDDYDKDCVGRCDFYYVDGDE